MKTTAFIILLSIYLTSSAQVDVRLFAKEETTEADSGFHTTIIFDLIIENNSDEIIYYPYNANTLNDEPYQGVAGIRNPINMPVPRVNSLIEQNDSSVKFERIPIVGYPATTSYYQPNWVKKLHLNYYGYPKDGIPDGFDKNNLYPYIDLIKLITINANSTFHIEYKFEFETKKRFTELLVDSTYGEGLFVKVVLFKYGMPVDKMVGNIDEVFSDPALKPKIIHKAFQFPEWQRNVVMEAITLLSKKDNWEDKMMLELFYNGGGW